MKLEVENNIATLTLLLGELNTIRYTLARGRDVLRGDAIYFNNSKNACAESANDIADKADNVTNLLESAVLEWITR